MKFILIEPHFLVRVIRFYGTIRFPFRFKVYIYTKIKFTNMCKTEFEKFDAKLKSYGRKLTTSKKKSEEFLHKIGVTKKNGDLSSHYQNLCIHQDRG